VIHTDDNNKISNARILISVKRRLPLAPKSPASVFAWLWAQTTSWPLPAVAAAVAVSPWAAIATAAVAAPVHPRESTVVAVVAVVKLEWRTRRDVVVVAVAGGSRPS